MHQSKLQPADNKFHKGNGICLMAAWLLFIAVIGLFLLAAIKD